MAQFLERLGTPVLEFNIADGDVPVPQGLLACCHVVHQPHCQHHVAGTLVGYGFLIVDAEGNEQPWNPPRHGFEGDILARPLEFANALQVVWLQAQAQAEAVNGRLDGLRFQVWPMNLELYEMWRVLQDDLAQDAQTRLARAEQGSKEWIESLPIHILLPPEDDAEIARVQAGLDFHPVMAYADRVQVLPSEIGHDKRHRYLTKAVWGAEGELAPAATSVLADPTEATV
jgi:hypothetical protein